MSDESVAGTKHWDKHGSGFPGDLSAEQSRILGEFLASVDRAHVNLCKFPHETDEVYACRLLRARKFEAEKSQAMLDKSVAWRQEEKVEELRLSDEADCLTTCTPDEMQAYYQHTWIPDTYDKDGRPVWVEKTGSIDIAAMHLLTTDDNLLRWHIRSIVRVQAEATGAATARLGGTPIINNCCTILDLEGFSSDMFSSSTRGYLKRVADIDQNHFPETMGHMFVINTPGIFSMVWAVAKTFVDERTRTKIQILGGKSSYLPKLLEYIKEEDLPVEYGGKKVVEGGLFPESRTQKIVVSSGKEHVASLDMAKGQRVRVRWFTRPSDIKFSLAFTLTAEGSTNFIVPLQQFKQSGKELNQHSFEAPGDGKLTITFDNKAGWRQREVHHRYDFQLPGGTIPGNGSLEALMASLAAPADGAGAGAGAGAAPVADAGAGAGAGSAPPAAAAAAPAPAPAEAATEAVTE